MRQACDEVKQDAALFPSWRVGYRPKDSRRAAKDSAGTHHSRGEYEDCPAGIFQSISRAKSVGGCTSFAGAYNRTKDTGQESCELQASAND